MPKYRAEVIFPAADGSQKLWTKEFEAEDMIDARMVLIDEFTWDMDDTVISVNIKKVI